MSNPDPTPRRWRKWQILIAAGCAIVLLTALALTLLWRGTKQIVVVPAHIPTNNQRQLKDPDHPIPVSVALADGPESMAMKFKQHDANKGIHTTYVGTRSGRGLPRWAENAPVTSMVTDSFGRLWLGTEGHGVLMFNPSAKPSDAWHTYSTKEGLGDDDVYSVACDHQGRIWAGHLNHGVSVFDGKKWKNYDLFSGTVGERVFRIAVCPTDGDIWIATNAGLERYSIAQGRWLFRPPENGIPFNQGQAIAFDSQGNIYFGTQSDGLAMSDAIDQYKTWRTVRSDGARPVNSYGNGLPSNLVNDILVARDGAVFVATDGGLARSDDHGRSWKFWRGKDWVRKLVGRDDGPLPGWIDNRGALPITKEVVAAAFPTKPDLVAALLGEDYCTCLAQDSAGMVWIGHRAEGCESLNPTTNTIVYRRRGDLTVLSRDFVTALAEVPGSRMAIGRYPGGAIEAEEGFESAHPSAGPATQPSLVSLPNAHQAPTLDELNQMAGELRNVPPLDSTSSPAVLPLDDDWRTEGDWLGRYGRYWACLCAGAAPDFIWNPGPVLVASRAYIDPNYQPDSIRHWIRWQYTTNRSCLELEPVFLDSRIAMHLTTASKNRRQASWDDHGEEYPLVKQGPGIFCDIQIPQGMFVLSLYDFNQEGTNATTRLRDYRILVHPGAETSAAAGTQPSALPVLAQSRLHQFARGGVYKRFLVKGPQAITVELDRNHSYNTMLNAIFLDLADPAPPPYVCDLSEWESRRVQQDLEARQEIARSRAQAAPAAAETKSNPSDAAELVWTELSRASLRNETWAATGARGYYRDLCAYYRANKNSGATDIEATQRLAMCDYQLGLLNQWEACQRKLGLIPARDTEKALHWDHVTDSYLGHEFQLIRDQVHRQPKAK